MSVENYMDAKALDYLDHNPEFMTIPIALMRAIGSEDLLEARKLALIARQTRIVERKGRLLGGNVTITVEFSGERT